MALFQPTNITPDLKGGVKNGTIIVPYGSVLTSADISWTVNGNSKMVAYQIDFYKNDAGSTQTGSTGKITLGTPFSAVSANGAEARFTATVAISYIADAIQDSGTKREGKFKITQWWGSGANDYVEQRSLSVFVYSREGKLTIFAPTIVGGDAIFTGSYLAPSSLIYGDIPLNWTRWQLIHGDTNNPLQDTGKVWGATDYSWSPDTIAPGMDYTVAFSAEMANGAEITAYSAFFNILQENTTTVTGVLTAGCDKAKGAASLTLNPYKYLRETFTGTAWWNGSTYAVDADSSATFQIPGGQFSGAPWHFIWHGYLSNGKIFEIGMKDGNKVYLQFISGTNTLAFSPGTSTTYNSSPAMQLAAGKEIYAVFTTGFFKNSETTGYQWLVYSSDTGGWKNGKVIASFTQSEIVSVSLLAGSQTVNYAVGFGTANASLGVGLTDLTAAPFFYGPQAKFPVTTTGGYKVAEMWYFGNQIGIYCLYRLDGNNDLVYVGMFDPWPDGTDTVVLLDYSALNGETYQYLVIDNGEEGGNAAIAYSAEITPCFWSVSLLEAQPDDNGFMYGRNQSYKLVQAYNFKNNVATGTYTNRSSRNVQPTFTPYPAVLRSTQNSRQGTLTGLIGVVQNGEYIDTNAKEQAIRALSGSTNTLFLRDRRGNYMMVALAGEISMTTNDNSAKQEITVSIPWVEIGDASRKPVFGVEYLENIEPEP